MGILLGFELREEALGGLRVLGAALSFAQGEEQMPLGVGIALRGETLCLVE